MEFHETRMGREFYIGTVPAIMRALDEHNALLKEQNAKLEKLTEAILKLSDAVSNKDREKG